MRRDKRTKRTNIGKFIECKFCHRAVWWDQPSGTIFELLGNGLHIDSCERRAAFFRRQGHEQAERARKKHA